MSQDPITLSEACKKKGRSLYWLSKESGVSYMQVHGMTTGRYGMTYRMAVKFAGLLAVLPEELIVGQLTEEIAKAKQKEAKTKQKNRSLASLGPERYYYDWIKETRAVLGIATKYNNSPGLQTAAVDAAEVMANALRKELRS